MLALLAVFVLGMTAGGRRGARLVLLHDSTHPDLPCPWCRAQTGEDDLACGGCGRIFG